MSTTRNLSPDELIDLRAEVEDARDLIIDAMEAIRRACRGVLSEQDMHLLERGVLAHITCALTEDHSYLGGNMHTLDDTIRAIEDAAAPACHQCGGTRFERPTDRDFVVCVDCEAVQ